MTIKASNDCIWVTRQDADTKHGGIMIPDSAKKSAHKGKIITVGKLVSDTTIEAGRMAVFNKSSGFEIEESGIIYTILRQLDIVGTDD